MTESLSFPNALARRDHGDFEDVLRREIEALGAGRLPLAQGLIHGSHVAGDAIQARIIGVTRDPGRIRVRAGIFFEGILAGCSCADDPTPVEPQNEYCELLFDMDTASGRVTVLPLP